MNLLEKKLNMFNFFVQKFINIILNNGIILIHPLCMYISYCFFIIFIFIFFKKYKNNWFIILKLNQIKKKLIFFSFNALFLGSYWAQQELNWGGWWNWDFVELIAFIFFIQSIILNHINYTINYNYIKNYNINSLYYLILFFFLVRLDLLNSIHSFNSFVLINNYVIYIIILFFLVLLFFIKKK